MNSKEYREFLEAYKNVYEQQIGVPLKDASDRAAKQQLQKMIPKGEKVYTPKTTLQKAHYEPDGELTEDLEERRKQLAQRRREQIAGFRQRISDRVKANRKRIAKKREREELKSEIKKEIAQEAVGDPISPNSVFMLSDPGVQKNLKSAMTRMGPPPMKTTQPKPQAQQKKPKSFDVPGTSFPF